MPPAVAEITQTGEDFLMLFTFSEPALSVSGTTHCHHPSSGGTVPTGPDCPGRATLAAPPGFSATGPVLKGQPAGARRVKPEAPALPEDPAPEVGCKCGR